MHIPYRAVTLVLLAAGFSVLVLQRALAGGGHYFPPVSDPLVKEECGSCHLAYPPSMLPSASWKRLMGDLKNHFGDDASVDAATAARIANYLTANAADTGGRRYGERMLRGLTAGEAPLRITELPRWIREHRQVPDRDWRHKDVRTRANCPACHVDAQRGYFDD